MRDRYFLAWGREADESGPERDDTIGKIVSIESCFVELEILSVNGHNIEQEYIHFTTTFVRSYARETRSAPATGRSGQNHTSRR
jgi:hypothetical protein